MEESAGPKQIGSGIYSSQEIQLVTHKKFWWSLLSISITAKPRLSGDPIAGEIPTATMAADTASQLALCICSGFHLLILCHL
ncbi:hypothetical protein V6N13_066540 [Hibiscus sabdariffa]